MVGSLLSFFLLWGTYLIYRWHDCHFQFCFWHVFFVWAGVEHRIFWQTFPSISGHLSDALRWKSRHAFYHPQKAGELSRNIHPVRPCRYFLSWPLVCLADSGSNKGHIRVMHLASMKNIKIGWNGVKRSLSVFSIFNLSTKLQMGKTSCYPLFPFGFGNEYSGNKSFISFLSFGFILKNEWTNGTRIRFL